MTTDLLVEPIGAAYDQLIAAARAQCDTFSLVWRHGETVDPQVGDTLMAHLLREEQTDHWPGTVLHGGPLATLRTYRLTDFSAAALRQAGRLYAWQHPAFPEDLAFYTRHHQLWLGSIAHEADAWFDDSVSIAFIRETMPLLELYEA